MKETEALFEVGEDVELKGCKFSVMAVYPDPANEITLKGKAQNIVDILKQAGAMKEKIEDLKGEVV